MTIFFCEVRCVAVCYMWSISTDILGLLEMSSANCPNSFGSPGSSEAYLSETPTVSSSSSPLSLHPTSLLQESVSFRPPTRPGSPVRPQTEQSSDVLQAIIISFPANLKSTPTSIDVSEPGLLWKVSRLYELIDSQAGYSASNSSLIMHT